MSTLGKVATTSGPVDNSHEIICISLFSRPALVVENIPGLYFIGNQRKPNLKIKVEHVVEDIAQEVSGAVEENKFEDLSVTDSTTSKFEKMEKIVKTLSEDQDSVVNDHAPSSKTNNNIR